MLLNQNVFILLFILVSTVGSAKILCVYPAPFHSHQTVFGILTKELARRGHEVVVIAPISAENKTPNVTVIDVKDVSYNLWEKYYSENAKKLDTIAVEPRKFLNIAYQALSSIMYAQLEEPKVQSLLKNTTENFDVILIEACVRSSLILSARFTKTPVIMVSSFYGLAYDYHTIGAVTDPIIFPDFNVPRAWNLPLWKKISSIYANAVQRMDEWERDSKENKAIEKYFGENAPTIAELRKNVQMLLLNVHHVWDSNRPVPPNVLYLGALHLTKPQPINSEIKTYLDKSSNGVIYMSLGSKIRSSDLPSKTINIILETFASLHYDFIWKWDAEDIPGNISNVRFEKWLPQNDMLYHPNIKAFITHAGLQSTDEAIAARVPLVGLPIRCDQFANAANYEEFGIGIRLNIDELNSVQLKQAIVHVAEMPRYRKNIDKLARLMEEERVGALDKAMRWINHIATHGGLQLRTPLPDLSFVDYYMLDVIGTITLLLLFTIVTAIMLLKLFLRSIRRSLIFQIKFKKS